MKFMQADDKTFAADAEQFWLKRVEVQPRRNELLENCIKRSREPRARRVAIGRRVLHAVGDPDVRHARLTERPAHRRADFARTDAMPDPKFTNRFVAMRQRETISGLRMRETSRIEVEAEAVFLRP